ncbi:MAG: YicC family protein [Alphaproteobacteria bacterium]|nr:MAG: YicC family protein [Alphaproteobacteria bacterium]
MTGFARATGQDEGLSWIWEIRSVNSRGLEFRARLPGGFESLDSEIRKRVQARLHRGSINVSFQYLRTAATGNVIVNRPALETLKAVVEEAGAGLAPTSLGQLLAVPGVVVPAETLPDEETEAARRAAILGDFDVALEALMVMRRKEGADLVPALESQLDEMERLVQAAESCQAAQPEALHARFSARVEEFKNVAGGVSEERLAQEVAVLAAKADVREELDRLASHVQSARALLAEDGPVGRKLDFLSQEFNREANTLCSKSADLELTRIGLALKAVIGQFREQIQNIE